MSEDHSNYYIIEIDQNTEKSPGDLRSLVVTQTSVKDHQLTLMWKTLKEKHGSPNLGQKTRPNYNQQKTKRICKIVDFAVPGDHRIKLKECEKKDKYLDLARELKKLWNMKVTIIPIDLGAFDKVTKGLLKGLENLEVGERVEIIQTTALLRTDRTLRRVLETWGDLLSLKIQWKTIS